LTRIRRDNLANHSAVAFDDARQTGVEKKLSGQYFLPAGSAKLPDQKISRVHPSQTVPFVVRETNLIFPGKTERTDFGLFSYVTAT